MTPLDHLGQKLKLSCKFILRSMIPHHSGAILMCQQAYLSDSEIKKLCGQIIESQRSEIEQMEGMLQKETEP